MIMGVAAFLKTVKGLFQFRDIPVSAISMVFIIDFTHAQLDVTLIEIIIRGDDFLGMLVIVHGTIGMIELFHDGTFINERARKLFFISLMLRIISQSTVNVTIVFGLDIAFVKKVLA